MSPVFSFFIPLHHSFLSYVELPLYLPLITECFCAVLVMNLILLFPLLMLFLPVSSALMEGLVTPLQDRIEEWKKTANQLDKDHAKGK